MAQLATAHRPLCATLYELGLRSDNPSRLADYYGNALGYRFERDGDGCLGVARDRRLSIHRGTSRTLAYASYSVANECELEALRRRLEAANVQYRPITVAGLELGAIEFDDPDGNHFRFGIASRDSNVEADSTAERPARVQHVVFASTDMDRLLSFFTEVMGFVLSDRVVDGEGGTRTAFVRCSHEHHSLAVFAASENRLDHHCYEVVEWDLIRDWADHFAKSRIPLKWGPGRHGPGNNLFLFIHDPDGNWVELSAELEHVGADRPAGEWPHEEHTLNSWGMGLLRS